MEQPKVELRTNEIVRVYALVYSAWRMVRTKQMTVALLLLFPLELTEKPEQPFWPTQC